MSLTDLSPIKDKVANEGTNEQGVLTSENWNMLVEAVDEVQGATIVDFVPSITPNSSFVSITFSLKTGKDTVKQYQITIPACDENNSGVFTPEQLQSFKALIQAAQNSIEAETNARQTADTALQTEIDAAIGTISTDEINSIPASIEDAVAMAKDTKHTRWTLIYRDRTVGVIDLFSDNSGHQLTEILTTNFVIHDNNWNQTEHRDDEIRRYFRTYNISSPYLENEKGTWTDWAEDIPITVRNKIETLENFMEETPKQVALTQEEYDDMAAAGTLDDDTYYNILEE